MERTLDYFCKLSQERLNNKIIEIKNERRILKEKPLYSDLKPKITNTDLYKNKPKIIAEILNGKYTELKKLLTLTIANSIKENMKLKPNVHTNPDDSELKEKLKKDNMEFLTVSEIFWGKESDITDKESNIYHNLILFICLDFLEDEESRDIVNKKLMEYIPYATYIGYEKASEQLKNKEHAYMLYTDKYRHTNVDVFCEAVYYFSKSDEAIKLAKLFAECINNKIKYDSKDDKGKYMQKTELVYFNNFDKAFTEYKCRFLEVFKESEGITSLGVRVYNLLLEEHKIGYYLCCREMEIEPGTVDENLTKSGKPYFNMMSKFLNTNREYVENLKNIQIELIGNIEEEYLKELPFGEYKSRYFSYERQFYFVSDSEEREKLINEFGIENYRRFEQKLNLGRDISIEELEAIGISLKYIDNEKI